MCDCIEKVEEKLREDTGDPEDRVLHGFSFSENGIKDFIPIHTEYRKKKKDGSFGRKTAGRIIGAYCPICGKALSEEMEAAGEKGN
jgi:hypothetical protein